MTDLRSHSVHEPMAQYGTPVARYSLSGLLAKIVERATALASLGVKMCRRCTIVALIAVAGFGLISGCVAYEPAPAPALSAFDRSWSAALAAAQDEGVQILSEDRASGVIRGSRGDQEVTVSLRSQADGSVRVEISARGPRGSDPGLAGRISRAYDRRMGR